MKKIISMILIVVMMLACLCVLTGCGDKNKDEENANVAASAPQYKWPNLTSYGISNFTAGTIKSLEEVGKVFNVTRERIRQIEAKALRKLRHPSRSKKLKDYLD